MRGVLSLRILLIRRGSDVYSTKIILTENYFLDTGIIEKLKFIKDIGNKGHSNLKKELTDENINSALKDVSRIGEWLISTELKKSGFNIDSWLPTMFSTLPLKSRVSILEELFKFYKNKDISDKEELLDYLNRVQNIEETSMYAMASGQMSFEEYKTLTSKPLPKQQEFSQVLLLIDKLAMAYLKNGNYQKAIEFINLQFKENFINETFKSQMLDKLDSLEKAKKQLPISQRLEETKEYFKEILAVVKEEEYSLFITLFTAIVAQDELVKKSIQNKN